MPKTRSNRKSSQVEKVTVIVKKEVDSDVDIKEELDSDFDISDSEVKHEVSTSESEDNHGDEAEVRWLQEPKGKKKAEDPERQRREKQREYERNRRKRDPRKLQEYRERKNKNRNEKMRKMTEENPKEYEVYKRKHQEAKKRSNQRMREENPEKYEAMKRRNREAKNRKLRRMKEEKPEEYQAYRMKQQEAQNRKRQKMREENPEEYKAFKGKQQEAQNRKRQKMREENPEEYKAFKGKEQEAQNRQRQRMREENPAEYEAFERKQQEVQNRQRQRMKEENPAEYEAYKRRNQEAKKRRRQTLREEDPEKWEAFKEKSRESQRKRRIAKEAAKREMEMLLKVGDPDDSKQCESKEEEAERKRLEKMMEENPGVWRELKKQDLAKMTLEERREKYHEMYKSLKEEEEERRKKGRFYYLLRRVQMTEEEKEAAKEKQRNYLKNLSGEKLERYKQSVAKAVRKRYEKIKTEALKPGSQITETARERWNNYCRKKVANETPEERQKRLRKYKINAARRKLRKELEEIGVSLEEIERRSKLMKEEMEKEPLPPLKSEYRPRLQGRKPHQVNNPSSVTRSSSRSSSNIIPNPGESSIQEDDAHFENHMFENDNSSLPPSSPCNMSDGEDTSQSHAGVRDEVDLEPSLQIEDNVPEVAPVNHVCEECKGSFISEDDVRTHFKLIHIQKCWKCPKCSELCISPAEFAEHYKSHSHDNYNNNQKSVKRFESVNRKTASTNGKTHTKPSDPGSSSSNATLTNSFSCLKCQEKYKSSKALSEHVRKFHRESFWQCPTCKLLKYHQSSLLNHQKFCNKKKLVKR